MPRETVESSRSPVPEIRQRISNDPAGKGPEVQDARSCDQGIWLGIIVTETAMGNPFFKPSDGDSFDSLGVGEDVTESETERVSGTPVLIRLKVRPETFPNGSPMSVLSD